MNGKQAPADDRAPGHVALDELLGSLELGRLDAGRYRAVAPAGRRVRLFGGHVLAQVIAAAAADVGRDEMRLRSLHATFVRSGSPGVPIDLAVEPTSDGRTFTTRRIEVRQAGTLVLDALARFHAEEPGPRVHRAAPERSPDPSSLATFPERLAAVGHLVPDWHDGLVPVDLRFVAEPGPEGQLVWFRAAHGLGDDPTVHAAVTAYASDMTLLGVATEAFGMSWSQPGVVLASLDHAMWFHESFRADDWTLYEQRVVSAGAGRALVEGSMFAVDGRLVASVVQDGVLRMP